MENVETTKQELEEAKARIETLEKENTDLQIVIEEGERQFKSSQHEITILETRVTELEGEISNYEDESESKKYFPSETMHDEMKRDYLLEIWAHYTPEQIESALPRKY